MLKNIQEKKLENQSLYLVSKWQRLIFSLSEKELISFFNLFSFSLHPLGGVLKQQDFFIDRKDFYKEYHKCLSSLMYQETIDKFKPLCLTNDLDTLYTIKISEDKYLLKVQKPVIYMQPYSFSITEGKIHPSSGDKAIFWGIELSYPTVFQDPDTLQFQRIDARFSNTFLFQSLRKSLRNISSYVSLQNAHANIPTNFRITNQMKQTMYPYLLLKSIELN